MENMLLEQSILSAKNGNELERERIITHNKPFIINVVSHICKKYISWSDEEASIGLLAFNKAIDTYEASKGRSFLSYTYCLINRALVNYFRKNKNQEQVLSLDYYGFDEESHVTSEEINESIHVYQEKIVSSEIIEEILELDRILNDYGIKFEELEGSSPKHNDTRKLLCKIVHEFITDEELVREFTGKKRFPATAFARKTGYSLKTIEKHRKYLIAMIIIGLHPEWAHLSSYVKSK
ncbi:MAG: RNA polymerase sigma-I factor [Bacillota bacterium]